MIAQGHASIVVATDGPDVERVVGIRHKIGEGDGGVGNVVGDTLTVNLVGGVDFHNPCHSVAIAVIGPKEVE